MRLFYLVGGFVRSLKTGEYTKDIDVCVTGTTYEELLEFLLASGAQVVLPAPEYHHLFFCNSAYQMPDDSNTTTWQMGVIKAKIADQMIDFCLARTELDNDYTQNNVVPTSVINTPDVTIEQDLARRDFTMNAMALPVDFIQLSWWITSIKLERLTLKSQAASHIENLIDPYGGCHHIEDSMIQPVGICIDRLTADPTRILRALKFALRLDYKLSKYIQDTLWNYEEFLCDIYRDKVNPDRSCNELVQIFKQAPSWKVLQVFDRYIPPSLLRSMFFDEKINLYPSLRL